MSPSAFFIIAAITAFFVAAVTAADMTARQRFMVHRRALAVFFGILIGGFVGAFAADYADTANYAWHIGIAIAVTIYAATAYNDRDYQRRIANGELLPFDIMMRYTWMLPRTPENDPAKQGKTPAE